MYYFYASQYTELCFNKVKAYMPNASLCWDLESIMISDDDKLIIEANLSDKIPKWVKKNQIVLLSEEPGGKDTIYMYQSYFEIIKKIKGQNKQVFSIISDEVNAMYAPLLSKAIISNNPVIICSFNPDTETDMLFDLSGESHLTLECIEPYLRKHPEHTFLELNFFKSLMDMTHPPKDLIINILDLLKDKYHLILNLMPIKNEFDLNLISISDYLIFIASEPTKLNVSIVEQLRHFNEQGVLHDIYLSAFDKKNEEWSNGLSKKFADLVKDCI
ncbi:hypothetical protein [Fusibacter ferrireducens]|uniref:Uncharacterized protein n=1 Tax=Fusibacter ferrireducens TaxID=2785058 RepID=A0ABR9ZNZ6_9FIRM|nr:hypothetical protein [Fusibacter ferrireducens]MBF4691848.1 hypothetical protein [Fusibacter ferrireducens]